MLIDVVERYRDILCCDPDDPDSEPEVSQTQVWVNGKGEDGHETFAFHPDGRGFRFCKTARKPYDLPVCEMLLILKRFIPVLDLRSDGLCLRLEYDERRGVVEGLDGNWCRALFEVKRRYGISFDVKIVRKPREPGTSSWRPPGEPNEYRSIRLMPGRGKVIVPASAAPGRVAS